MGANNVVDVQQPVTEYRILIALLFVLLKVNKKNGEIVQSPEFHFPTRSKDAN